MSWFPSFTAQFCPAPYDERGAPPPAGKMIFAPTEAGPPPIVYKFTYFGLFAKGPAPALALALSGVDYEISFPADWKSMKPTTNWGHLPVLEMCGKQVGHEIAILNVIGQSSLKMGGLTPADFSVSQQLLQQAEDIYQKLVKGQNTLYAKDKSSAEESAELWGSADATKHSGTTGIPVPLGFLEAFCAHDDKFTDSGVTVGECKLWAVLHTLKMIKPAVLDGFPKLAAFYARVAALEPTTQLLEGKLKGMSGPFKQYFVA